jgi:hypothetical protein
MKSVHYLVANFMLIALSPAFAQGGTETDTFNCGQGFVEAGTSKADVLKLCGEPTRQIAEDQWIYERGSEQFTTTIYFEADGTIGRIDQTAAN